MTILPALPSLASEPLQTTVLRLAQAAGFAHAGIAPAPLLDAHSPAAPTYLEEWIARGYAGEMEYLKRRNAVGELVRSSLHAAVPWARSVIVCVAPYHVDAPLSTHPAPAGAGWIARYAWSGVRDPVAGTKAGTMPGEPPPSPRETRPASIVDPIAHSMPDAQVKQRGDKRASPSANEGASPTAGLRPADYHKVLLARLKQLEQALHAELGDFRSWAYVDTGPMIERAWAAMAGVGWTGKNTCTLNQGLGSFFFLGVILTSLEPSPQARATIVADRCGSCTRCIDACPTNALIEPHRMDASRCIAYLTIEKRGSIPEVLRRGMGRQVFGCDICQDVCPWNRKAPVAEDPVMVPRSELVNPSLAWLAQLSEEEFARMFYGSPVKRAKFAGLRRNVAIAMGNSGDPEFIPQLEGWSREADPVLAESARWALAQLAIVDRPAPAPAACDQALDGAETP